MEAGVFDNLPDRGKPILLDANPYQDPSLWMAHHLLRVNGFAPAWIEEAREIDESAARLKLLSQNRSPRAAQEVRDRVVELNRRILTYNLKCPSPQFHKRPLDVPAGIQSAQKPRSEV